MLASGPEAVLRGSQRDVEVLIGEMAMGVDVNKKHKDRIVKAKAPKPATLAELTDRWEMEGLAARRESYQKRAPASVRYTFKPMLRTLAVDLSGEAILRSLDACTLPLLQERQLHLSDHAENGQDHLAHWSAGVDCGLKDAEVCALLLKLMYEVQNVAGGASQPVELGDNQRVARAYEVHERLKLAAALARPPRHFLGSHDGAACGPEHRFLHGSVLRARTHPRVSDQVGAIDAVVFAVASCGARFDDFNLMAVPGQSVHLGPKTLTPCRAKGVYQGRPPTFDHAKIVALRKQGKGATEIARAVGCQRGNVYKALKASGLK